PLPRDGRLRARSRGVHGARRALRRAAAPRALRHGGRVRGPVRQPLGPRGTEARMTNQPRDAHAALARLAEGNRRFAGNEPADRSGAAFLRAHRSDLAAGQEPFAIVLGCADSRVPAELVFDQGFGDLFVIRVAGNIVAPSQVGSVEFAAARYDTRP